MLNLLVFQCFWVILGPAINDLFMKVVKKGLKRKVIMPSKGHFENIEVEFKKRKSEYQVRYVLPKAQKRLSKRSIFPDESEDDGLGTGDSDETEVDDD